MFACRPPGILGKDVVTTGDLPPSAGPGFTQVPQTAMFSSPSDDPYGRRHMYDLCDICVILGPVPTPPNIMVTLVDLPE